MELGTLGCYYRIPIVNPEVRRIFDQRSQCSHNTGYCISYAPSSFCVSLVAHSGYNQFKSSCTSSSQEFIRDTYKSPHEDDGTIHLEPEEEDGEEQVEEEVEIVSSLREESMNQNIWNQMKEIMMFSGPAVGLWICGPLMSLIDTAVIGQGSSIELAALGPGTVICDYTSYVFMFLSIATSNMVATSLARQDKKEVQHHISVLLFVGLSCGVLMLLLTKFLGSWALIGKRLSHTIGSF